jgi:hypothetical protein
MSEPVEARVVEAELSVIRPGDTVLVRLPREIRAEQAERLAEQLRERLPDVEVLLMAGADGIDVYRSGEAGGPDGGERTSPEGPGEAAAP